MRSGLFNVKHTGAGQVVFRFSSAEYSYAYKETHSVSRVGSLL